MGFLDKLRRRFSSRTASPAPHRGASTGRRMAGLMGLSRSGPNAEVARSRSELIPRSRHLVRNTGTGRKARNTYVTDIVGTGIKPRPITKDKDFNTRLMTRWAEWVKKSDPEGVLDFYGQQAQAVGEMFEGGEVFGRFRTRRLSDNLPAPFQLQLLPTEMCPFGYMTPNEAPTGIVKGETGQRLAYIFYRTHPGDLVYNDPRGGVLPTTVRIPSAQVVHMYDPTRAGQDRGLPWMSAALTAIFHLDTYLDNELERKKNAAAIVYFIKKASAGNADAEELAKAWGDILAESPAGEMPSVKVEAGTIQYLDLDEDVTTSQPAEVGGTFEAFVKSIRQDIASALDLLYPILTSDWSGLNDRLFKAQVNAYRRRISQIVFHIVVHQFVQPVYEKFVRDVLLYGLEVLPEGVTLDEAVKADYRSQRFDYLHPLQDVQAQIKEIEAGLTSREATIAERGDDIEVIDAQRQRDSGALPQDQGDNANGVQNNSEG